MKLKFYMAKVIQNDLVYFRRKQVLSITEDKSKKLLEGKLDKAQNDFVGRAGLTHQTAETVNTKQQVSQFVCF